ncbi:dTMP kinase [Amycolatopsis nalaikhensis]|uniref:Thymidylate kinase n=1 Tax=Amycolatopsis nalaikhensis TaxID=715472 RepID=A0ABY8X946_9PSEU|nr:dTMP kinase [Amycolatopsis sp. 2-2]WIV52903.1 dTMP kinase [Amycolatopsis sp. 2-2]
MRQRPRGLFVTIDGPAGVGKTTTTRLLREHLAQRGYQVHATTQPSRGMLGDTARHNTDTYRGHTLACLVAADRYHHLEVEVRPQLAAGSIVVCDRYVTSSYVLQCMDGVPLAFVEAINAAADVPDLAVILQAPPDVTAARVATRGAHDRFHTGEESSRRESELYEQAAERLARWRYPVLAVDTAGASPPTVASYLTDRIAELAEGPDAEVATA